MLITYPDQPWKQGATGIICIFWTNLGDSCCFNSSHVIILPVTFDEMCIKPKPLRMKAEEEEPRG